MIFDANLCQVIKVVPVVAAVNRVLFVPNVFTPNNDGVNDYVTIFSDADIEEIEFFQVFTRWGDLVFERRNFQPNIEELGWDGSFKDQILNPGVYVYHAQVKYLDLESTERLKGDITLLR